MWNIHKLKECEKQNDLRKFTNFFQITDFKEHSNVAVEKKLSIL